jgi:hypothetical protein
MAASRVHVRLARHFDWSNCVSRYYYRLILREERPTDFQQGVLACIGDDQVGDNPTRSAHR